MTWSATSSDWRASRRVLGLPRNRRRPACRHVHDPDPAIAGPTVYDRILATNALGTKTIVFVTPLGYISGRTEFIDMAIIYALVSFITTIAILKFAEMGRLD